MDQGVPALFGAGLLTFFSPCILPLVPLYLSFLAGSTVAELRAGGDEGPGRARLMASAAAFSAGLAAVFVLMGMGATALGNVLADHRLWLERVGGVVVVLFGLKFLGLLRLPFVDRESRPWLQGARRLSGLGGAFLFGAAFAFGWTPCVGPVLGSVLTYTASKAANPAMGALYLAIYALGLVLPLLAAAWVAPTALRWLDRAKRGLGVLEKATGALLVAMGLWLALGGVVESLVTDKGGDPAAVECTADSTTAGAACAMPDGEGSGAAGAGVNALRGPVMLAFTGHTCPICKKMAPVVREAETACGLHVPVQRIDVGTPQGIELARRFGVRGLPTYVYLDDRGQEVARLFGLQPLAKLMVPFSDVALACVGAQP
jgi:cytochrome c-type biogenesis protein